MLRGLAADLHICSSAAACEWAHAGRRIRTQAGAHAEARQAQVRTSHALYIAAPWQRLMPGAATRCRTSRAFRSQEVAACPTWPANLELLGKLLDFAALLGLRSAPLACCSASCTTRTEFGAGTAATCSQPYSRSRAMRAATCCGLEWPICLRLRRTTCRTGSRIYPLTFVRPHMAQDRLGSSWSP